MRPRRLSWRPEPAPAARALAATLAALALGGAVLAAFATLAHPVPFALDFRTTPFYGPHEICTHLSTIKPFFDARGQSLAHLAVAGATAGLGLAGLRKGFRWEPGPGPAAHVSATAVTTSW